MTKIRLRGLKLLEGGAQVISSCPGGDSQLAAGVCAPLAQNKINITFLAHLSPNEDTGYSTVLCTEGSAGRAAASVLESCHNSDAGIDLQEDVSTISIFVHDQRPQVSGAVLHALAKEGIPLRGLASSPSAVSSVVSSANTEATITAFFDAFEFPAYRSPSDWYAAYEGKEHLLRKIIASYQEKVIKIYDIVQEPNLDLWSLVLPAFESGNLGRALITLDRLGFRMPFVVAQPSSEGSWRFACCFPSAHAPDIGRILGQNLATETLTHHSQVAALFIHGPHFGDRYGIAHTFVQAVHRTGVPLLALNCAVSSISAVIPAAGLDQTIRALDKTFQRQ